MSASLPLIDIGSNLLDEKFGGFYNGKQRHEPDLHLVLERASAVCDRVISTSGTIEESARNLELLEGIQGKAPALFTTVGVHPTRSGEGTEGMEDLIRSNYFGNGSSSGGKVVALGELGLDYDRLEFSDKDTQHSNLMSQLQVNERLMESGINLPLFLHSRSCGTDLLNILKSTKGKCWSTGVVHSFDSTISLAEDYMDLGLYIGLNGCSLKTDENLEVVRKVSTSCWRVPRRLFPAPVTLFGSTRLRLIPPPCPPCPPCPAFHRNIPAIFHNLLRSFH